MKALSPQVCEKILEDFRRRRLNFPDSLLQDLANNYGLDSPCDIDPLDIVEIISNPGHFDVFSSDVASEQQAVRCLSDILIEAESKGVKVGYVAGALLVVKQTNMRFSTFAKMHMRLMDALHPEAQLLQAMYSESSLVGGVHLMLILSGIDALEKLSDPQKVILRTDFA